MRRLVALAVLGLLAAPAGARADVALEELGRLTPVAGYAGWHAWSAYDEATGRYALRLLDPHFDAYVVPRLQPAPEPWDVQLGPDASGVPTLIYRSCDPGGCDLRRRNLATGAEQQLGSVSSPFFDEATPAIWRSTVVFTRRIRGCDVPYVKDLRSGARSRRLLHTECVQTRAGHASIRGTRIVISSQAGVGAGQKSSELRRYSSRARGSRVIVRQNFGEESNLFGQVVQDERFATTVRYGFHPVDGFVRVAWGSGRVEEVPAHKELGGGFARRDQDRWIVVEAQEEDEIDCQGFAAVPCRLVGTLSSPFSSVVRKLTPELTVAYEGTPRRGQPLTFSGTLTRRSVSRGEVVRTEPLAGATVDLRHRTGDDPERFEPTGLTAVTDANGRWRIVLPAVGDDPWYTAVAATGPTWAGRGTVGSVEP